MAALHEPRKAKVRMRGSRPVAARGKMRAYRARMQAAGMRQVQIWVPDVRAAHVRKEASRQSRLVSRHADERETLGFIEQVADIDGWK